MRARGAHVTDLVVLVIAADDGIKPQTIEAINHAKAAGVPILIALNKMDLPGANPERAKQELMNHSLVPEDFGGDTIVVPVSAKTGDGVERLLEMLALQSEILELRANPNRRAEGVVIESQVEPGRGVTATALVLKGTLRIGDVFLCGPEFGKIRSMRDDRGQELEEIVPGRAAEITGLRGAPPAGETFLVVPDEKAGRLIAETRSHRRRTAGLSAVPVGITMEETEEGLTPVFPEKERASFKLIIRADVQGSVEAVRQSLTRLEAHDLKVEVLHSGVGSLTVSDVNLAMTTGAALIGFGVRPEPQAAQLAEQNNVTFHLHRVIYELIDDIRATIRGVLEPEIREEVRGRAEVRKMFRVSNVGNIAGCFVTEGELQKGFQVRLIRDGVVVTDKRKITSLRRFQDDVNRVQNGNECGVSLEGYRDIRAGDILEAFTQESIAREVTMAPSGGGAS
jgi:translation initiation factor IF-2